MEAGIRTMLLSLAALVASFLVSPCIAKPLPEDLIQMSDWCPSHNRHEDPPPDHSVLTTLLQQIVVNGTRDGVTSTLVDYGTLKNDPSVLKKYMDSLCNANIESLSTHEQLALWANAYNALMLATVVHYSPVRSIQEVHGLVTSGSVWKEMLATIGGEKVSLDIIEHKKIRGGLSQSAGLSGRIHSALVCASLSCPDLQPEAFTGATLVSQVTIATQKWLNNPTKNPGPNGDGDVIVSDIFRWYPDDFIAESGSLPAFLRNFSTWTHADIPDQVRIGHAPYNWNLNAQVSGSRALASRSWAVQLLVMSLAVFAAKLQ